MTRAAIYARYSSDHQRDASIEDQLRICRRLSDREGWLEFKTYEDAAISGATTLRSGYQQMLEDARGGRFDVVVAEALDRLSRDQEDIAGLYKQLSFCGIALITSSEGPISELHVGLKGTMNALFLKDLADKTRRGLEGRVRAGRSGGGISYGFRVVNEIAADGTPVRGMRCIDDEEAVIVRHIFSAFAGGQSPKSIAHALNRDGVPGPAGRAWGPSTIYGNWRRGTGILNNELYIGRLVWNRQRFVKDPETGKRQARPNPEQDWIVEEVPELRIIDENLWQRVKARQQSTRREIVEQGGIVRSERARRPRYLLSGLLRCGRCGGGFSKISQTHYGCSTARNKGTCTNLLTICRDTVEASVLDGLREHLMHPDCVKAFVAEFHREMNRLAAGQDAEREHLIRELDKTERDIARIIDAIKAGVPGEAVRDEMAALEARKRDLAIQIEEAPKPVPRLHPNLAELYRRKVDNLTSALNEEGTRQEASEAIRQLIDEVRLVPENGTLNIELYGELAALVGLANEHPRSKGTGAQITLVAGARNHLYRTSAKR